MYIKTEISAREIELIVFSYADMDKRAADNLNKHGEGTSKKPRIDADVGEPFPIIIRNFQFKAVSKLKRLFSNGHIFHYTEALQNGVVPYLVKFITRDDLGVQLLSASLIADMTLFPKAVDVLIDNGAVEQLSVLLDSSKDSVMQEEIISSLGNMAPVSQESYNKVTKTALCLLVHIYAKSESTPVSVLNMLEWTLSIIKRGFGADEIEIDETMVPLSIITCPSTIDKIIEENIVDSIVSLSKIPDENTTDCIQHKVYENFVLISSKAIRALVEQGIIKKLKLPLKC
ncbi:unnamed protein product [Vicia faba]|uniref:Uncharacterized protein n=1 Tax=Vicia faba TaxID=3906 RepID=A0AAV1B7K1_VICFA|nr:unnamed protein product [Vicia faba]